MQALTPIRETVEKIVALPDRREFFLCHAWDDRTGAAKELHTLLQSRGVSVWFSERDITLGAPLLREIDKGLAKSKIGIVLVTPALLERLKSERERVLRTKNSPSSSRVTNSSPSCMAVRSKLSAM